MIEFGDLWEGIMGENFIEFYEKIFELLNIEIVVIGFNLNCLYGVMFLEDKLIQFSFYKQFVEVKFNKKI